MITIKNEKQFDTDMIKPLLVWYDANKRILPWRENTDPYRVWISEIMLQQTRVEAVKPYFDRFTKVLPDVESLAFVEDEMLFKLWEGLGYYNRARNLKKAAIKVMEEYDGRMPDTYELLSDLPGIGSYTAGAIASISFQRAVPAVDGNVLRIMTRLFEDETDILSASFKKSMEMSLRKVMPQDRPGDFNQALMELGATVCLPNAAPKCEQCPIRSICKACANHSWDRFPYKKPAKRRRVQKKTIILLRDGENILIHKRPDKGLLAGLYEFPNLDGWLSQKEITDYVKRLGLTSLFCKKLADSKHIFSHIEWHMKAYLVRVEDTSFLREDFQNALAEDYRLIPAKEIEKKYAIPSAFKAYTGYANIALSHDSFLHTKQPSPF